MSSTTDFTTTHSSLPFPLLSARFILLPQLTHLATLPAPSHTPLPFPSSNPSIPGREARPCTNYQAHERAPFVREVERDRSVAMTCECTNGSCRNAPVFPLRRLLPRQRSIHFLLSQRTHYSIPPDYNANARARLEERP